jgi:GxxExxY protein
MGMVIDYPEQTLTRRIIGAAIDVHRELGAGLLESAYKTCLAHELKLAGLSVQQELRLGLTYKGLAVDCAYRADMVIEDTVLLELKAIEKVLAVHESQLLTYLKISGLRVGLLLNFHESTLRDGIRRLVL